MLRYIIEFNNDHYWNQTPVLQRLESSWYQAELQLFLVLYLYMCNDNTIEVE